MKDNLKKCTIVFWSPFYIVCVSSLGLNHIIFSQLGCNENEERVVLRLHTCFGLHRAQLHVNLFLCFIFKHTYKTIKHVSKDA